MRKEGGTAMIQGTNNVFYRDWRKTFPVIHKGEGIYLFDTNGKKYLDASGSSGVINIGHGVSEVINAMLEQARKICFTFAGTFASEAQIKLAKKVIDFSPTSMSKVYFVSGGSEATEIALKLVRQYHVGRGDSSRVKVITRWQGYHGATMGALSLSGHISRRMDYLPYLLNFPHIQPSYCYRCPFGKEYPACGIYCAYDLERTIKQEGKESIAAFIAEPIVGFSLGAVIPPAEYFPIVREICDRYGILFVADEVVTGFGRTGKNFGIENWGVVPDLIIAGKGIGSGYTPLGAVIVHERVYDVFLSSRKPAFFLGYTYSGNPLSCAVGLAVLEYIEKRGLVERSELMGKYLFERLSRMKELPMVGDIRGKGLLLGIELVNDKERKTPFESSVKMAETVSNLAFKRGLILKSGSGIVDGISGDHITISPPFIIDEDQIEELGEILEKVILEVHANNVF
jgi:adenosylmethionine-8-amino-7-oxononanoate aminotransferase